MRQTAAGILYSASDLVNFLGCSYATAMDRQQLTRPVPLAVESKQNLLLQEKGIAHERAYLESLRKRGFEICEIVGNHFDDKAQATRAAMHRGAQIIYQGVLSVHPWHGYSDFLVRVDDIASKLGNYSYEVADTKLARTPKPKHVVQLCIYSMLVAGEQGIAPDKIRIVLGTGREAEFRLEDFRYYVDIARRRFEDAMVSREESSAPEPCGHCQFCHWSERCGEEWQLSDHLSLVANITRQQRAKLVSAGVSTVAGLSALSSETHIPKMAPAILERLRGQASLQVGKRADGMSRYHLLPEISGKGFDRLPPPDNGDLYFDMEGHPMHEDGALEYLFGFVHRQDEGMMFTPFWAHDRTQEKSAFEQAVDFVIAHISRHPAAHVYHYAAYEETALKRLAMMHGTREAAVDMLLRDHRLVDLYKVVREGLRISEPGYSIKNLEAFYMDKRSGAVKNGGDSIVMYERWRASQM